MTMNRSSRFRVLSSQCPPTPRIRRDLAEALRAKAGVFRFGSGFAALAFAAAWSLALTAQQAVDGPQYTSGNALVRPANYREWVFIGSALGLTYDPAANNTTFTNVFVNPAAYRGFMSTGRWPDKSVFVLEFRASATDAPPNTTGRFQTRLVGLEAEVKDARFPDGWAFYNFRLKAEATQKPDATVMADSAPPLAGQDVASCVECHTKSTAVERTFVQFYPTLLEVARAKGTVKPGF